MRSTVILSLILGALAFGAYLYMNRADFTTYRAGYYMTYGRMLPSDGFQRAEMRRFIEEAILPIRATFDCTKCVLAVSADSNRALVEMQHPSLETVREAFAFISELQGGPVLDNQPTYFARGPATFVENTPVDIRDVIYYLGVLSLAISLSLIAVSGFRQVAAQ